MMDRRWCVVGLGCVWAVSLWGCVEAPESVDVLGGQEQAIINGTQDTTRQGVVAILNNESVCTGTIVQKNSQGIGWVLTAAHCVDDRQNPPLYIVQGNDYSSANATYYEVIDWVSHPAYTDASTGYDFAVIRFAGAGSATPVIPIVTGSDGLSRGSSVTSVGFGRTSTNPNGDDNTRRWRITKSLSEVDSLTLVYSLSGGGICFGDSGGPVLATVSGAERVVGVHSAVTGDCSVDGYSGRVSGVYGSWLSGVLSGAVEQTCDLCRQVALSGEGACTGSIEACTNNASCNALLTCLNNCQTDACSQQCADNNAAGVDRYLSIFTCVCEDACPAECAGDASCPEEPTCGVSFSDVTCNTCLERSCCAELSDCAEDSVCLSCLSGEGTGCSSSRNLGNFSACAQDSCASQCGIEEAACGFGAEDDCGTCLEGRCCDEGAACADNAACAACAAGEGTGCDNNALLDDFLGCLGSCNGDPCGVGGEEPANNTPANNNPGNNNPGNNNPANNNPGNNNPANNNPGNNNPDDNNSGGFVDDNNGSFLDEDDDGGRGGARASCSAVSGGGGSGVWAGAVLGLLGVFGLMVRRR